MLSRRIASASIRSAASFGAKPLPLVQRRTFFPPQMNSPKIVDEKYPDYPKLTDAEDPDMVSAGSMGLYDGARHQLGPREESEQEMLTPRAERRLHQPSRDQEAIPRPLRQLVGQAGEAQLWRAGPRRQRHSRHLLAVRVHVGGDWQGGASVLDVRGDPVWRRRRRLLHVPRHEVISEGV